MKRLFILFLSVVLVLSTAAPSFAVGETSEFDLENVIENYEPHTEEELAAFKAELREAYMLERILYPERAAGVYVITDREFDTKVKIVMVDGRPRPQRPSRYDLFEYGDVLMGIKKDNSLVNFYELEKYEHSAATCTYDRETGVLNWTYTTTILPEPVLIGSEEGGQLARMRFSQEALDYIYGLSDAERENYLLNFYLSVYEAEDTIGLTMATLYGGAKPCTDTAPAVDEPILGDVNGDTNVNAIDCNALVKFLSNNSDDVVFQNCDLDQNGKINAKDNFFLKKAVIGG